jgi:SAM-dependent methyltransferase
VTPEELEALHGTFHRLEQRWNTLPIPQVDGWHAYEPLPFWDFLAGLAAAAEMTAGRRLLDLGCGIGRNLALALHLGWRVAGIDHNPQYIEAARELLPEADLRVADILDEEEFDADLVYMYRPARGEELEAEVETFVLDHVTSGTVLFWPGRHQPEVWVA